MRGTPAPTSTAAGSLAWRASASFSANGQRPRDNNYMLDGVDNNETWLQTVVIFPSVDALDEFKLQTSTYSAEFGRSMGGVVNLQIKSGSNASTAASSSSCATTRFDANNLFNNRARDGRSRTSASTSSAATLGGPIIKDKTFFFADYQGLRINQGQPTSRPCPRPRCAQGNFSEINRPIYDPLTGQPFPGNIIPQSRFDPASANVLSDLHPRAEHGGHAERARPDHQQLPDQPRPRAAGQPVRREDRPPAEREQPLLRALQLPEDPPRPARDRCPTATPASPSAPATATSRPRASPSTTPTPSARAWLNEFRFGCSYIKFFMTPIDYGMNLADAVGHPRHQPQRGHVGLQPDPVRAGRLAQPGRNGNQPLITNLDNLQIFDNVTHIRGRHTIKAGGSVTFRSREILNADTIVGQFFFSQNQTSNCAGRPAAARSTPTPASTSRASCSATARRKNRALFDDQTYTEKRPE